MGDRPTIFDQGHFSPRSQSPDWERACRRNLVLGEGKQRFRGNCVPKQRLGTRKKITNSTTQLLGVKASCNGWIGTITIQFAWLKIIDYYLDVICVLQIMAKEKHKQSDVMGVFSLRLDKQMIEDARSKAKKEGRAISVVLRKMVDDWLSNRYKPFEDS